MPIGVINKAIAVVSPKWALQREHALSAFRLYDIAKPSHARKHVRDSGAGNNSVEHLGRSGLKQARYLDENHDLARGILNDLVRGIVGRGITSESMVKSRDGKLNTKANKIIRKYRKAWERRPEVTQELGWGKTQQLLCRSWLRDGEVFSQSVFGTRGDITYPTKIPFLIELLESDMIPLDYEGAGKSDNVKFGIKRDSWGKATRYYIYKKDPSETYSTTGDLKEVNASLINHCKFVDRIRQSRGVTVFASIIARMEDIKDYEESERIAARVAAALTGYIEKPSPVAGATVNTDGQRTFEMMPGMIFDNLAPGEKVGMISSDRPSTQLEPFRKGQLRAAVAGTDASYSNVARDYDGSYSSQRQELVIQDENYSMLREHFISSLIDPIYRTFIDVLLLKGLINRNDVDIDTIYDVEHRGTTKPEIDPLRESKARNEKIKSFQTSVSQTIRDEGRIPSDVYAEIQAEQELWEKLGITQNIMDMTDNTEDVNAKKTED